MNKKVKPKSKTKGPSKKDMPLFENDWHEFIELSKKLVTTMGMEVLKIPMLSSYPEIDRLIARNHIRLIDMEGDPSDKLYKIFKVTKQGRKWYEEKRMINGWNYDPADDEEDEEEY